MEKIPITKLDAARRQIDTAITLWFHDGDPVCIHTLAAAAHGVLHDLLAKEGKSAMMLDPKRFRKETFGEWKALIREAQNFFKHADNDPAGVLLFSPKDAMFLLFDAVSSYVDLVGDKTERMTVFWLYVGIHNPHYFGEVFRKQCPVHLFTGITKQQFFQESLPVVARRIIG